MHFIKSFFIFILFFVSHSCLDVPCIWRNRPHPRSPVRHALCWTNPVTASSICLSLRPVTTASARLVPTSET